MLTQLMMMKEYVKSHFIKDERGQGMVEYGLIIALVSIAVIVILGFVGDELVTTFTNIRDQLQNSNTPE